MVKKLLLLGCFILMLNGDLVIIAQTNIRQVWNAPILDGKIDKIIDEGKEKVDPAIWGKANAYYLENYVKRTNEGGYFGGEWHWGPGTWPRVVDGYTLKEVNGFWMAVWCGNKIYFYIRMRDDNFNTNHSIQSAGPIEWDEDDGIQFWFEYHKNVTSPQWNWNQDVNYFIPFHHVGPDTSYFIQHQNLEFDTINTSDHNSKVHFAYAKDDTSWSIEVSITSVDEASYTTSNNPPDCIWFNLSYNEADDDIDLEFKAGQERWLRLGWGGGNYKAQPGAEFKRLDLLTEYETNDQILQQAASNGVSFGKEKAYKIYPFWKDDTAAVELDGKIDEPVWNSTIPVILTSYRPITKTAIQWKFWDNFSDAAVIWRGFWRADSSLLYLAFNIFDDHRDYDNLPEKQNLINDDGLLIWIDSDQNGHYDRTDINILIHNNDDKQIYRHAYEYDQGIHENFDSSYTRQNIQFAISRDQSDANNWSAEVRIEITPVTTENFPIEIGYNDADTNSIRDVQLVWSNINEDIRPWLFENPGKIKVNIDPLIRMIPVDKSDPVFIGQVWDYKNWKDVFWYLKQDIEKTDTLGYLSKTKLTLAWNKKNAVDKESGIDGFRIQIKNSLEETAHALWDTTVRAQDSSLVKDLKNILVNNGLTVCAVIQPVNGYWRVIGTQNLGREHFSWPVTIDTLPPLAPGIPQDQGEVTASKYVSFTWGSAVELESQIIDYQLHVGTTPGESNIFNKWLGGSDTSSVHKIFCDTTYRVEGKVGQTLFAVVRAKNAAGLVSVWSDTSDGITILPVDIVFAVDLSKNMMNEIEGTSKIELMKKAAICIMESLKVMGVDNFGLVSFADYPGFYTSCSYSAQYGGLDEYPWHTNQELTTDLSAVTEAIERLHSYSTGDAAQAYARALFECLFLNWRKDARKFVVMIGNTPAHDCDFFQPTSYGTDPGFDGKIGTWDDLNYENAVDWVNRAGITILAIDNLTVSDSTLSYRNDVWKNFEYMANQTGGRHFTINNWDKIPEVIEAIVVAKGLKPENFYPEIIEAETMFNRKPNYGMPLDNGWKFTLQDKPIYTGVVFLKDSTYHFNIAAQPEFADNKAPWLKLQANGASRSIEINQEGWNDYGFSMKIPKGFHCLSLTFLNDWWDPYQGDRNLLIDKVTINYQPAPPEFIEYVFEAEKMSTHSEGTYLQSNYWVLNLLYSSIEHDIYFEPTSIDCKIYAKADRYDGDWPGMFVCLDADTIASFIVNNASDSAYSFILPISEAGKHRITIAYDNSRYREQRRLYIDKLICSVKDGGLLKGLNEKPVALDKKAMFPEHYGLAQNLPNPFNPDTYIVYQLPEDAQVELRIFNTLGQEIITLLDQNRKVGSYSVYWNGLDQHGNPVGSGIYLYQMKTKKFVCTKKMIMLK